MKQRVISGAVLVIVLFLLLYFGGYTLLAGLLVMSEIGLWEYCRALGEQHRPYIVLGTTATAAYYGILFFHPDWVLKGPAGFLFLVVLFLAVMADSVFCYPNRRYEDGALTVCGVLYIAVLFSFIYFIRTQENGFFYSWYLFLASWGCDTCAYFAGRALGKHKLVPRLSPKKTVEGAIGGVLGATALCMLYGALIGNAVGIGMRKMLAVSAGIGCLGSVLAQVGDLFSSSIKRFMGIKDYGNLIPGHGGILDRFDSVLLTGPVIVLVLKAIL